MLGGIHAAITESLKSNLRLLENSGLKGVDKAVVAKSEINNAAKSGVYAAID